MITYSGDYIIDLNLNWGIDYVTDNRGEGLQFIARKSKEDLHQWKEFKAKNSSRNSQLAF